MYEWSAVENDGRVEAAVSALDRAAEVVLRAHVLLKQSEVEAIVHAWVDRDLVGLAVVGS